ncbi:phosphomannomutase [Rhodobacter calidifons]|uniref:Phosphomannomutase n=1 Tax=Rhodobacter calidifons TaxID=2715277 RepID=A0ABX0G7B1_9RHOB|nr:phosphomannomutase [Rhodobacter calidifons]NHB76743.1 phosphomannomutase [Rhodobacter calidifons]
MSAFKTYDIRGRLGTDLTEAIAHRIARAFALVTGADAVVLARDCRESSPALADAVAAGLVAQGVRVLDLGLAGTEEMYFATAHLGAGGGICVTASHNPREYNGMKLVGRGAVPLPDGDFARIRSLTEGAEALPAAPGGAREDRSSTRAAYVAHVAALVGQGIGPLRLVVNAGNGAAGPTLDALAEGLAQRGARLDLVRMHHAPDGTFPNGIPNPLLPENRPVTAQAVRAAGADMGVAFDGDFDRCFLFDGAGGFVDGEHVVALLAAAHLASEPGATIIHDPRVIWAVQDAVRRGGGRSVLAPTGHIFLKAAMRREGAVYGGEMSAHHYFRGFMACDSGMIPWLLVARLVSHSGRSLTDLVGAMRRDFPSSGEINFRVAEVPAVVARVQAALAPKARSADHTDGLSLDFGDWRMNLRASNTEPLLRLNVEARGDAGLVAAGVARVRALIEG